MNHKLSRYLRKHFKIHPKPPYGMYGRAPAGFRYILETYVFGRYPEHIIHITYDKNTISEDHLMQTKTFKYHGYR